FRKQLNLRPEEKLLLFVGSGFKKKGLARALRAFGSLTNEIRGKTKFLVVGQDKQTYFKILSFCLFISKQVSFLGGKANVSDFLFAADLLILPALDENTGTVILEAIVSGTPVLTTENCGYSNYVVESGMGDVVSLPFQQNALNRSLEILLKNIDKEDWLEKSKDFLNHVDVTSLHEKAANKIHRFAVKKIRS
ncbi:MAG: glycosyltransferase family 4 protein, partial [Pseudomonadota bacterium]|nr:glycosyltransferase family 4 protein [Pseudomonadota bacterium]